MDSSWNWIELVTHQKKTLDPDLRKFLTKVLTHQEIFEELSREPDLLRTGRVLALIKASETLLDRGISSREEFLRKEILQMLEEVRESFEAISPSQDSNWEDECYSFGEKKALHWDWKYFGSRELF